MDGSWINSNSNPHFNGVTVQLHPDSCDVFQRSGLCLSVLAHSRLSSVPRAVTLSPLAGPHPSALSICSKLRLSVFWVTISPPLRGSSSWKHWHITPLQFQLASTSCYLSSYRHAHVTCTLTTFENSRLTHTFLSSVCNRGRDIRVLKSARQPSDLLCELGFGTVPPYLVDGQFLCLIHPAKWFLYLVPPPHKMISLFDCHVERLRSAFADVSGLYREFGWVTFLSLGAFLNHRVSKWRLSKKSCRRTEIPVSDKHLIEGCTGWHIPCLKFMTAYHILWALEGCLVKWDHFPLTAYIKVNAPK